MNKKLLNIVKLVGKITLFFVLWGASMAPLIFLLNHFYGTPGDSQTIDVKILFEVCTLASLLFASLIVVRFLDKRTLVSLGFLKRSLFRDTSIGLIIGFLMVFLCVAVLFALGFADVESSDMFAITTLFGLALFVGINSITQEILIRGYPLQSIEKQYGSWVAVLASSVLFTGLHAGAIISTDGIMVIISIFLAGILLGLAYTKTRNLWLPIAIHFAWNFTQGPVLGIPVTGQKLHEWQLVTLSGPALVSGGEYGLEGGLVALLVTLVAIGALFFPPLNRLWPNKK